MVLTPAEMTELIGDDYAANGHLFDKDMECKYCKKTWLEHQENPHACVFTLKRVLDRVAKLSRHVDREVARIHAIMEELGNVADYKPDSSSAKKEG